MKLSIFNFQSILKIISLSNHSKIWNTDGKTYFKCFWKKKSSKEEFSYNFDKKISIDNLSKSDKIYVYGLLFTYYTDA